jgi:protein gp37
MGDRSAIEWTDATWNPIVGCSLVSPGCTNCYAMARIEAIGESWAMWRTTLDLGMAKTHYRGTTQKVNGRTVWTGKVAIAPEHILTAPLRWRRPRRIFVNSMGDLFHESIPVEWIDKIFEVAGSCDDFQLRHTLQILTKRAARMRAYMQSDRAKTAWNRRRRATEAWPPRNIWLGVSAMRAFYSRMRTDQWANSMARGPDAPIQRAVQALRDGVRGLSRDRPHA